MSELLPEIPISPLQCRLAREVAGLNQADLAARIGVAKRTVLSFERGGNVHPLTRREARRVLEQTGVVFLEREGVCRRLPG